MTLLLTYVSFCLHCARREWEDVSAKLGRGFDITSVMGLHSDETLRNARSLYDTLLGVNAPMPVVPRADQRQNRASSYPHLCICMQFEISTLFLLGERCGQERRRKEGAERQHSVGPEVGVWVSCRTKHDLSLIFCIY